MKPPAFKHRDGLYLYKSAEGEKWILEGQTIAENVDVVCANDIIFQQASLREAPEPFLKLAIEMKDRPRYDGIVSWTDWKDTKKCNAAFAKLFVDEVLQTIHNENGEFRDAILARSFDPAFKLQTDAFHYDPPYGMVLLGVSTCREEAHIVDEEQTTEHGRVFTVKIGGKRYSKVRMVDIVTPAWGYAAGLHISDAVALGIALKNEWSKRTEADKRQFKQERLDFERKQALAAVNQRWAVK